jgi:hypothetical protein
MTLSLALALLGVGMAAAAWAALRLRRWLELRRVARRFARGLEGQRAARGFLEDRGFEVLAEEQVATAEVLVDDERLPFDVRVDFIVRRRRRTYAVEVKTGEQAVDPLGRATRRQLREYAAVLPVDGVLLLDMEAPRLMRVCFPSTTRASVWPALLVGLALGVALALSLS